MTREDYTSVITQADCEAAISFYRAELARVYEMDVTEGIRSEMIKAYCDNMQQWTAKLVDLKEDAYEETS